MSEFKSDLIVEILYITQNALRGQFSLNYFFMTFGKRYLLKKDTQNVYRPFYIQIYSLAQACRQLYIVAGTIPLMFLCTFLHNSLLVSRPVLVHLFIQLSQQKLIERSSGREGRTPIGIILSSENPRRTPIVSLDV